jgi:DNA polymerase I-like protein with 3'-5' exonuclease and polymerase domains
VRAIIFDAETNGLLDRKDLKILCGGGLDMDTGEEYRWRPGQFDDMAKCLSGYDVILGHNVAGYDIPLIERFHPGFTFKKLYDTRLVARQRFIATLRGMIYKHRNRARSEEKREERYPKRLFPRMFSLESLGYLIGHHKGAFLKDAGVQEEFSEPLLDYCMEDIHLTKLVYEWLHEEHNGRPAPPDEAMYVESCVGYLLGKQERNGVRFDVKAANKLYAKLSAKREAVARRLREEFFPPWWSPAPGQKEFAAGTNTVGYTTPTRTYKVKNPHRLAGREAGCPFTKIELKEFNPASGHHIVDRLTKLYGWKPKEFTSDGMAKTDETVLSSLNYEPAKLLTEYALLQKRIGQIAEGKQAWLKLVTDAGLLHGSVMCTGARTSRMSHARPNLAQVPKVSKPYGAECRAMFSPTKPGWSMVGCDASAIDLRMMAHRLAFYDGGAFGKTILEGDVHSDWQKITGHHTRDGQKTCTYAFIYGAGDTKLGTIFLEDWNDPTRKRPPLSSALSLGREIRRRLMKNVYGLETFVRAAKKAHKRGWVTGLDGRIIECKSEHGVLNDVFQSDAAIVMKMARMITWEKFAEQGLVHGVDFEVLLDVHDEHQFGCRPGIEEPIGETARLGLREAGERLRVRVPIEGKWKAGKTWADTH